MSRGSGEAGDVGAATTVPWISVVERVPAAARAVEELGDRGDARRRAVRGYAEGDGVDDGLGIVPIVLALQREAAAPALRPALEALAERDAEARIEAIRRSDEQFVAGVAASGSGGTAARSMWPIALATIAAIAGPVLAFPAKNGGFLLDAESAAMWGGAVSLAAAAWMAFAEPRRRDVLALHYPPKFLVFLAVIAGLGLGMLWWQVARDGWWVTWPVVVGSLMFLGAIVLELRAFAEFRAWHRRHAPEATAFAEQALADADAEFARLDAESLAALGAVLAAERADDALLRRGAVVDGLGVLYLRGLIDAELAEECLARGLR
ncbi:hypothetical protein [Agromyces sp. NPDC058064]|uniref:hypothetical protein n=1 Tax=Agromyces sp. NPDC058064 TaxID=3346322 RepID=UPI0036DA3663